MLAEEESILDNATVLGTCDVFTCYYPQLVIGPGFKSRWYSTTGDGTNSNEVRIQFDKARTPHSLLYVNASSDGDASVT